MTLNDIENWVITGVAGTVATLIGALRYGDVKRIERIEQKQREQDDHVAAEVRELRLEFQEANRETNNNIETKHAQIIGLLMGIQRKQ